MMHCQVSSLKLLPAVFYQIFIFSPNNSPFKTMKNVFYFIKKALFKKLLYITSSNLVR